MTDNGRGWDSPEARAAEREDLLRLAARVQDPDEAADLRHQATAALGVAAFIAGPGGFLHLVVDTDPCGLCHGSGQVRLYNPEITDGLTEILIPRELRIWHRPCPFCRHVDFCGWQPPDGAAS
ncbi:hypothetical protein [Actinoplanes xinjiangensis]|uniref:hypothetical protein n=1 Tax=Actinoplanes xinjiangensis TaxID=512350 RepID=UPI003425BEF1